MWGWYLCRLHMHRCDEEGLHKGDHAGERGTECICGGVLCMLLLGVSLWLLPPLVDHSALCLQDPEAGGSTS